MFVQRPAKCIILQRTLHAIWPYGVARGLVKLTRGRARNNAQTENAQCDAARRNDAKRNASAAFCQETTTGGPVVGRREPAAHGRRLFKCHLVGCQSTGWSR